MSVVDRFLDALPARVEPADRILTTDAGWPAVADLVEALATAGRGPVTRHCSGHVIGTRRSVLEG